LEFPFGYPSKSQLTKGYSLNLSNKERSSEIILYLTGLSLRAVFPFYCSFLFEFSGGFFMAVEILMKITYAKL